MAGNDAASLQDTVGRRLGVTLAKHPSLRNSVNTLLSALTKAKVIAIDKVPVKFSVKNKAHTLVPQKATTALVNAVLLNGVFGAPKLVVGLFTGSSNRVEYAKHARALLIDRQSVAGLGLVRPELIRFIELLGTEDFDLSEDDLPNPFADSLPQMGIGPAAAAGSLLRLVATQWAPLSRGDSMMAHYLDGNLEQAYQAALEIRTDDLQGDDQHLLSKYRDLIMREYEEASAFGDLLEEWR